MVQRPPPNDFPLLDVSMRPLFLCCDAEVVVRVLAALLQESRVAVVSSALSLLTPVVRSAAHPAARARSTRHVQRC